MTAEKAIEILSDFGIINRYCAEDAEVLDMAIKALDFLQECEDRCKESIMRSSEVVLSASTKSESEE